MSPEFEVVDQEWAENLERGVESYTDMLFEAIWDSDDETVHETLSKEPFCGCSVCFWREAMFYLVPKIISGYKEGKITVEE